MNTHSSCPCACPGEKNCSQLLSQALLHRTSRGSQEVQEERVGGRQERKRTQSCRHTDGVAEKGKASERRAGKVRGCNGGMNGGKKASVDAKADSCSPCTAILPSFNCS